MIRQIASSLVIDQILKLLFDKQEKNFQYLNNIKTTKYFTSFIILSTV
jgi:hypothetical protein